ncbi:Os02g0213100 [Oryza sativa Japonica Group]|uniref:Os02g0213100 protein n=2 Tax=Oryza sativa subsp. japonica TaxID=39947 RepID=A0A0P0VGB4_ORYSJ|nr:hypothetical protein EE612_009724 [Oryza sativa]KAF2943738.1 hypothetical protein DAI22_02g087000 [Oryza sativa Japonica Group]BAD25120.1 unknown protein [Oryza sativa Japonica Group]BAF08192.1 Os02g0213100 [Oryza sativa Japonica Group]BAG88320.1 unnamed protein product [Oryza sativa Japonica Group]|eukprot:NP_001046278.1 Os02g0213100 [Oryza sativa Japonica Group]
MARLQRRRLVLALLQLAVALWLAATSGCFCRQPPSPIAGVSSPPILPDGNRPPKSPPAPASAQHMNRSFQPGCPPDCTDQQRQP